MTDTAPGRPKVILDCDPGLDDLFAILCALKYCNLLAVTSVAGNVAIDHTTRNALAVLELADATHVPVYRGAGGPINGTPLDDARHVHGETGLGGIELPPPSTTAAREEAVDALLALTDGGDVTVVAVGPLTNIALAIQRDAVWVNRVSRLVIMGGSTNEGNVTPFAEFNIYADPEAAAIVFESDISLTMAGLNLTRQVMMGVTEIQALRSANTATSRVAADGLDFYSDFGLTHYGRKAAAMHDPCAVIEVVRPDLFERRPMKVDIELTGTHTRGMTVCDHRANAQPPDTDVLVSAARDDLVQLIIDACIAPTTAR